MTDSTSTDHAETEGSTSSNQDTDGGSGGTGGPGTSDSDDSTEPTGGNDDDGEQPTGGPDDTSGGEEEPEVYACTFEERGLQWSLPQLVEPGYEPYTAITDDVGCGQQDGFHRYQVLDITGDGAPDLVVTDDCDPAGVGTTRWEVYENDGSGFADQPTQWSLPQLVDLNYEPYTSTTDDIGCGQQGGSLRYQLVDITGDRAPDLVVTDNCDPAGAGTTRWDVYENDGSGFADQPTQWSLPQLVDLNYEPYIFTNDDIGCSQPGGSLRYQLLDITGDGAPDFVVTDNCDPAGAGTTRWDVYENDGSGFADQPTQWSLPQLVEPGYEPYIELVDDVGCGAQDGFMRYLVLDVSGDAAPDLVVTDHCDPAGAGTTRWDVYENDGSGFSDQPTPWSLPQLVEPGYEPYTALADDVGCGAQDGFLRYLIMDLTADGAPDFLVTDNCDARGTGTTHWTLFAATCAR